MSGLFTLEIIAADRVFYHGKAQCVILPALDGEKAIMAHHEEMVLALKIGTLKFKLEDDSWVTAVVSDGFADMANNRCKVIVYSCERPEEIDVKRAKEAKERAEEQLRQKQSIIEYHVSSASLARAMARLKEANKIHPTGY